MSNKLWREELPGDDGERCSMDIDAPEVFDHPCGFVRLKERHRVKAGRSVHGAAHSPFKDEYGVGLIMATSTPLWDLLAGPEHHKAPAL